MLLQDKKFSLLELASVREDETITDTLRHSLCYAQRADELGFERFWLAEHHNMEGIASAATSVLIGHIASGTKRIKVGSGGIMLPNHPPLVIAEQFGTLACLYPGRIELGLGRAPGTDAITMRALRRDMRAADDFPQEVGLLQQLLAPLKPGQKLKAIPGAGTEVPIWLLGSSLFSAQLAAQRGLPYAFAGHFAPRLVREALHIYRESFQPSETLNKPYAMLGLPLIAADTDREARHLATTSHQRILSLLRGNPLWLKPPVDDMTPLWSPEEEAAVKDFLGLAVVGGPDTVREQLETVCRELPVDEFMFTIDIYDPAHRSQALEILAALRT
ncbi:LLM class flavin-dependent oxidoreductase [Marinimicrobium sp. ARAG 43.8]|uniref:LLM class flavin-dependent oxidoreductase n=1 Tax=Marinimicrobium sp. ARAG 43.8 TaxID=3418719 RepID=UPI003CEA170F